LNICEKFSEIEDPHFFRIHFGFLVLKLYMQFLKDLARKTKKKRFDERILLQTAEKFRKHQTYLKSKDDIWSIA